MAPVATHPKRPARTAPGWAASVFPAPHPPPFRHTAVMAIRVSVQAATEDECVEGLAQLVDAGYQPVMMPRYMTDGRWMARAVPTTKAPAVQADSRGPVASG